MPEEKGKGRIINHSSQELLILETDSGPAIVHRLGPKRKSPENVDTDAFRRSDGNPILLHSSWWKVPNHCTANIYQIGDGLLIPVSVMVPVPDKHFGNYEIREDREWGEKLSYLTDILKDKKGKTIGYAVEGFGEVSIVEAVKLADEGKIDNVTVVKNRNGKVFLRTKKNTTSEDNLA